MTIERVCKHLLMKYPYFGYFLLGFSKRFDNSVETLGVSLKEDELGIDLVINEKFWNEQSDTEQVALMIHECYHIIFHHLFMNDGFPHHNIFNMACDIEVNQYIEGLPLGALYPDMFNLEKKKGAKYYYDKLLENDVKLDLPMSGEGGSGGSGKDNSNKSSNNSKQENQDGQGSDDSDSNKNNNNKDTSSLKPIDSHDTWKDLSKLSEGRKSIITGKIEQMAVEAAENCCNGRGIIPEGIEEVLKKIKKDIPRIFNWVQYFRRLLGNIYDVETKKTRRKESFRFEGSMGMVLKKKVNILVAIDTSGSLNINHLSLFFIEIDRIRKAGADITILECDAKIHKIYKYKGKMPDTITGRGGTDFQPVFDYYIKNKSLFSSLIFFTDGYAPLPKERPSNVVWVIDGKNRQDYPGIAVYIPNERV